MLFGGRRSEMGRSPCCEKVGLKKGPWTPDEDQKLLAYIEEHGHGSWRALPAKAGLQRCGKSCRLRWTNYLRPDIKRGKFSLQEEQTIIQLHALLGNRWSAIATHLPKRTDNEIKNYWNTYLKKRLTKMGIDPVTHKPKIDALSSADGHSKSAANLSHMAQWESARLEAEARLVRESKLRAAASSSVSCCLPPQQQQQQLLQMATLAASSSGSSVPSPVSPTTCLDVLGAWQGQGACWSTKPPASLVQDKGIDLESPSSTTLSLSETIQPISSTCLVVDSSNSIMLSLQRGEAREVNNWKTPEKQPIGTTITTTSTSECKERMEGYTEGYIMDPMAAAAAAAVFNGEAPWLSESSCAADLGCLNFTSMLQDAQSHNSTDGCGGETHNNIGEVGIDQVEKQMKEGEGEENKDYWSSVLKLLSSSFSVNPNSTSVFQSSF